MAVGPVRSQTEWMTEILTTRRDRGEHRDHARGDAGHRDDRARRRACATEVDVPLGAVIVNRVLPELFTHADEETFEALREPERARCYATRGGPGAVAVLDAARLAVSLRRTRRAHLERAARTVELPLLYVPYLFVRDHGLRVTRMVADALGAELGQ